MGHIPYGYIISNGIALIDEEKADKIRKIYDNYLNGLGLLQSAKLVGINTYHSTVSKMLENKRYIGDGYYPRIISNELFNAVQVEREKRANMIRNTRKNKPKNVISISTLFCMKKILERYDNPFEQAEYIYSLIERVDEVDDS